MAGESTLQIERETRLQSAGHSCPFARTREASGVHLCLAQQNQPVEVAVGFAVSYCITDKHILCERLVDSATGRLGDRADESRALLDVDIVRPAIRELSRASSLPIQHEAFARPGDRRQGQSEAFDVIVEPVLPSSAGTHGDTSQTELPAALAVMGVDRVYLAPAAEPRGYSPKHLAWAVGIAGALCALALLVYSHSIQSGSARVQAAHTPIPLATVPHDTVRVVQHATSQTRQSPASAWTFAGARTPVDQLLLSVYNPNANAVVATVQAVGEPSKEFQIPGRGSAELNLGRASGGLTLRASSPILPQLIQVVGSKATSRTGTPLPITRGTKP
jgi:hypothetical protein